MKRAANERATKRNKKNKAVRKPAKSNENKGNPINNSKKYLSIADRGAGK